MTEQAKERTRKRRRSRNKFENLSLSPTAGRKTTNEASRGEGEDGDQRGEGKSALPVTAKWDCEPIMGDGRREGGRAMGRLQFVRHRGDGG